MQGYLVDLCSTLLFTFCPLLLFLSFVYCTISLVHTNASPKNPYFPCGTACSLKLLSYNGSMFKLKVFIMSTQPWLKKDSPTFAFNTILIRYSTLPIFFNSHPEANCWDDLEWHSILLFQLNLIWAFHLTNHLCWSDLHGKIFIRRDYECFSAAKGNRSAINSALRKNWT